MNRESQVEETMVALKANEVDRFLKQKEWNVPLILIYGPDIGLVSERAGVIIKVASGNKDDPFNQTRFNSSDLIGDKARLAEEVLTVPLFGEKRIVWLKDGNNSITDAVKMAVEANNDQALIVVEAGDLKKGASLRKFVESHKTAVAIPCYPDNARDLDRLIDEEIGLAKISISREARTSLHGLLGADRLASRGELKKLCLYAHEKQQIEVKDVEAVVGDASVLAMDSLVDSVILGNINEFDQTFNRLKASGTHASVIAGSMLKHLQWLQCARPELDKGRSADQIIASAVPPIYFRRRPLVARQIPIWNSNQLAKAATLVGNSIFQTRVLPLQLGYTIISETMLTLARISVRNSRQRTLR